MKKLPLNLIIIFGSAEIILSLLSFLLFLQSVGEEPFIAIMISQMLTQIIGSTVIIVLWLELLGIEFYFMLRKGFHFIYIILLLWGVYVLYWSLPIPYDYISDIVKFHK